MPILYLSRYIIFHKSDYYRLLLAVTLEQAWEEWILYMLTAVKEAADWTTNKIRAIKELMDNTAENLRREMPAV